MKRIIYFLLAVFAALLLTAGTGLTGEHYLIVTTNAAYNECHAAIDAFRAHKESQGFDVLIKTETDFEDLEGDEVSDKVRNLLIMGEESWGSSGIDYILIIADNTDIPMKQVEIYPGVEIPTDWYYADLDGDWDLDTDGIYAEYDDDFGPGGVDFDAEASVGRIIYKEDTLPLILERIINHQENMYDPSLDQNWRYNILQAGAFLEIDVDGTVEDCGSAPQEYIYDHYIDGSSFSSVRLYDPGNAWTDPSPNIAKSDADLDDASVYAELESFNYGTVIWQAHGSTSSASRRLNMEYMGEIQTTHEAFVSDDDAGDLYDGSPTENNPAAPVIVAAACLNGTPEADSIATRFMDYYAVNFIGSTVVAQKALNWTQPEDGGMQGWSVYMAEQLIGEQLPVGDAFTAAIAEYFNEALEGNPENAGTKNCYCMTLYGDPSLPITIAPWTELAALLFGGSKTKGFFADEKARYRFRDDILAFSKEGLFLKEAMYRHARTLFILAKNDPRLWKGMVEADEALRKISGTYFAGRYSSRDVPIDKATAGRLDGILKELQTRAPKEMAADLYSIRKILGAAAGRPLGELEKTLGFGRKQEIPQFCVPAKRR